MSASNLITVRMGRGFFNRIFGGKSFMHCLIEVIKNSLDWGGDRIAIDTSDHKQIGIWDNGRGMDSDNRNAFASVNCTTAEAARGQAGKFGTGTKQFLFSQAKKVRVRTAPADEPGWVYIFEFSCEEYEELFRQEGTIEPQRVRRTSKTWPYESSSGTEITYTLREPSRRGILRGQRMADESARRLPRKFRSILVIDGELIPEKEIEGTVFEVSMDHPQLGPIAIELYRPRERTLDDGLFLGAGEIGEISIQEFARALGDLRRDLPAIYLDRNVCGNMTIRYVHGHANEDRKTVNPSVADDPHTRHLLEFLRLIQPAVQSHLQIRVRENTGSDELDIEAVRQLFNTRYSGERPGKSGGGKRRSGSTPDRDRKRAPLRLVCDRGEYEPGEIITITAKIGQDQQVDLDKIRWLTSSARADNLERTETGCTMIAKEVGSAELVADVRGTPLAATVKYEVVNKRMLGLSAETLTVRLGREVWIRTTNLDRTSGQIVWSHNGVGEIVESSPERIKFAASSSGRATVTAYDEEDMKHSPRVHIRVVEEEPRLIRVRDIDFRYDTFEAVGAGGYDRPATLEAHSGYYRIVFNSAAAGYAEARAGGTLADFLASTVAHAFPLFYATVIEDMNLATELSPVEVPDFVDEMLREGDKIYAEIMSARKK